ncbi:MAG: diadenylate cyclase [Rickettsiales bacterium]|jgi:diadenylate cyclase|nr:diadenylate cyclase [Rickettsiales bacterium]
MQHYIIANLESWSFWIGAAEVAFIIFGVWMFYNRFIKRTGAEHLVRGLFGLAALWFASGFLSFIGLNILAVFSRWVALFLSVGLIVIFQPELRKFLGLMGQVKFLRILFSPRALSAATEKDQIARSVGEIVKAVEFMSHKHTGALIVFQNNMIGATEKVGTRIDAIITSELLLTIFFNKTPLHDGAVFIGNNRIISAGAILPLTQKSDLNWKYGTRHRAAIGMSESSDDAVVLVVSEETGDVSLAERGKITKYEDMKKLRAKLEKQLSMSN